MESQQLGWRLELRLASVLRLAGLLVPTMCVCCEMSKQGPSTGNDTLFAIVAWLEVGIRMGRVSECNSASAILKSGVVFPAGSFPSVFA